MTDKLTTLAGRLRAAAAAYYESATLVMSDAEYDAGIEELKIAAAEDPARAVEFDDLLNTVAAGQSPGGDVPHPSMMGSMNKVVSKDAIGDLLTKINGPVVVEPKLDGLAIRVEYTQGRLTLVATRGDGYTGEDVTARARKLRPTGLPLTLPEPLTLDVRGELLMFDDQFPTANKIRVSRGESNFVNTRNAAAGILRKGDAAYAGLTSFALYELTGIDEQSYVERRTRAKQLGFVTAGALVEDLWSDTTTESTLEGVLARVDALLEARDSLGFPIDGVVIRANDTADRTRLGEGRRAPNWAAAYKYEAETATTIVQDILTDVGRTGRLSITVIVDPVFVGGATVGRASGHNVKWMLDKDVRIGDTVQIRRANDVIPYVDEVLLDARPESSTAWAPPAACPVCGSEFNKSTLLWRCESYDCSLLNRITYAASRDCLDIEHLGTEIATALVEKGYVDDIADLFTLTQTQLADLELTSGRVVGEKVAVKIAEEIERVKGADWNRVITALGIRATGRTMGRRLATAFPTMQALRTATVEDLAAVDGIAVKKAQIIRDDLNDLEQRGVLDRLERAGVNMGTEPGESTDVKPLEGERVVVTGKVGHLTRTEVQELIERLGGKASSSVSSSTTLLVADPAATSSKVRKALDLGIRIITPEELLQY